MSEPLTDILRELTPIHEAMARFEKGGPARVKFIERLYRELDELGELRDYDAQDDLREAEERIEELEEALEKASELLLRPG